MKITINGSEYKFEMNGTVGVLYVAQRLLGNAEPLDLNNAYHVAVMWYAVLVLCNDTPPTLEAFLGSLTTVKRDEMNAYVNRRWAELEGVPENDGADSEKKN